MSLLATVRLSPLLPIGANCELIWACGKIVFVLSFEFVAHFGPRGRFRAANLTLRSLFRILIFGFMSQANPRVIFVTVVLFNTKNVRI